MDVGEDTALGDGDVTQKLVQLLVVADGELKVTGDDARLLVVTSGVASQFENLSGEVLKDSGEIDGSAGTDTLGVVALAEETVDTTNGEREARLGRTTRRIRKLVDCDKQTRPKLERDTWMTPRPDARDAGKATRKKHSRLRVLGTARLATGLAAASHFEGWGWCWKKV